MNNENETLNIINNYIHLLSSSLNKILKYNSSCVLYCIEGAHVILQIYSALILSGQTIKETNAICEGSIQLFVNCLYILDNINTNEINSYIDIIKELLYSKSIGNIKICNFAYKNDRKHMFLFLKTITAFVLLNKVTDSKKNIEIIGRLLYLFSSINEMEFFEDKIQDIIVSQESFKNKYDMFCISSLISLQIYS